MTDEANLNTAIADSEHRLAEFAERCAATAEQADEITGKLRDRWQRRVNGASRRTPSATDDQEWGNA